jgi:hypothetical protein
LDTSETSTATQQQQAACKSIKPIKIVPAGTTSVYTDGFTGNARIRSNGRPVTYYVEYGPTKVYGTRTPTKELPPRLIAHYKETFDEGLAAYHGGISASDLSWITTSNQSYARYTDRQGAGDDANHYDGIGIVHLPLWTYTGTAAGYPSLFLGGGDLDLRGARVKLRVRGNAWNPSGTELVLWTQSDIDLTRQNSSDPRRSNWAHTGYSLNDAIASGQWKTVSYDLENDSHDWTYAGRNGTRPTYQYWSLDESLAHVNTDLFHNLVFINLSNEPSGSIDFDDVELTFRNHSLLIPSNGGHLVSAPAGGNPNDLTDGWRNGPGHCWESKSNPSSPLEFRYDLDEAVSIMTVQIHQNPTWPSREVEVLVSTDGTTWTSLTEQNEPTWTLPEVGPLGPNHAFFLKRKVSDQRVPLPLHEGSIRHVKIRILSGYKSRWGLGEIEIFGTGAHMSTDDDWYSVSQDIVGLVPGTTYHYRFVTDDGVNVVEGPDQTYEMPNGNLPLVTMEPAMRVRGGSATLNARVNPLGVSTHYYFEYGTDTTYGSAVPGPGPYAAWAGLSELPRPVLAEISGLVPGKIYHYRVVTQTEAGTTFGGDQTVLAK